MEENLSVRLALMIEGQEGVTWEQWLALGDACERSGVETLFRSDHYLSGTDEARRGSLDAWTTLAALAARTSRLRLGTLVSPVTFRHPSLLAKAVATVDHVSDGRVELGIGAGWHEREHAAYGFSFPQTRERMELLAEQVEIVHRQWTEERVSFAGRHYRLDDCPALPKPRQQPRPPLIVGGSGTRGTLSVAARFADEYNTFLVDFDELGRRRRRVAEACEEHGRDPETLRFSLMTGCVVGSDASGVRARAERLYGLRPREVDLDEFVAGYRARGAIVGTVDEAVEQLSALAEAGVERVMLQHLLHDDLETVELIGRELAPALA